jgi:UDP-glucose 4-epimerase
MRVMVTGASGFIGRYVVEALLGQGREVLCVGRTLDQLKRFEGMPATLAETDYSESSLEPLLTDVGAIIHLAGKRMTREDDPTLLSPFVEPNIKALENILRAATKARVTDFVMASTIAVYSAKNNVPFREADLPHPLNAYGLSKLVCEQYAEIALRGGKIKLTNLRFAAVYGHGEKGTPALMRFIGEARAKKPLTLQGNRLVSVDQLYVRDAAAAIIAALGESNPGGTFNVGCGTAYSVIEMAETVNSIFGNAGNLVTEGSHAHPVRQPYMDTDRAAEALGWRPRFCLREGLQDFLAILDKGR